MKSLNTKTILFYGINFATVLFALSYQILYNMGLMAMQYAEKFQPLEESGIYVFLTFGHIFFVVGFFVVVWLDLIFFCDALKEYYKVKNEGWL